MRRVRVCHVTSVHSSSDTRIFQKECTSLAKLHDYEVFLVAKGECYIKNNVTVIGLGEAPVGRRERFFSFSRKIIQEALSLDADIYHLHDPELLQFVSLLKKKQKLVVFDQHEDVADSILDKAYIPLFFRKLISFVYKQYAKRIIKKCDAVISVTPHIIDKLKTINNNVYMITNYPIVEQDNIIQNERKNYKSLVFAGGIFAQWSHELIIRTLNRFSGMQYDLYGSSDDNYLEALKQLPGWDKVNYHGVVSFQEVKTALNKGGISVALLQPSHNTADYLGTLGNTKIFESMNAGLPIICTDFILWKEIVEKAKCGICIDPNSSAQLYSAIEYLVSHRQAAVEMGVNGQKAVLEKYNWKTQEAILFKMYEHLKKTIIEHRYLGA